MTVFEKYVEKGGKRLRYGYTTGSCATAAAAGATRMLLTGARVKSVTIDTPKGWPLDLTLHDCEVGEDWARCSVIKDAGDDPDITGGVKVYVTVRTQNEPGIRFSAGVGVGMVTLKGLSVPVGEPAINPVPRQMITREMMKIMQAQDYEGGFEVEISIPDGVELAKRTFNPKLGIQGGLSIVGTSGIVEPMSEDALKASMKLEISMLKAQEMDPIIFIPGNYGKDFALEQGLPENRMVKTSNYVGFMLEEAEDFDISEILVVGHLGKLVKVAGGLFNTHSGVCDGRMEILAAHAALLGADQACVAKIMGSTTTDEATDYLLEAGLTGYFDHLAEAVKKRCEGKVYGNIHIEVVLFSKAHGFLGASSGAKEMEGRICNQ